MGDVGGPMADFAGCRRGGGEYGSARGVDLGWVLGRALGLVLGWGAWGGEEKSGGGQKRCLGCARERKQRVAPEAMAFK